jgi:hypothetical protein
MPRRLIAFLASLGAAGCYSPPEPDCGFICGPGGACPADYTCAADHHCHHDGTAASLSCGAPPVDAGPDVPSGPQIVTVLPGDGASVVSVNATVDVYADQDLVGNPQALSLADGTTPVPGTARFIPMGIEFTPDAQLAALHHFTATLATGVTNAAGDPLPTKQWSFDTANDNVPPHVQASAPASGDTGVPVTTGIRVTFDEPVTGVDETSFTAMDGATAVAGTIVVLDPRTFELRPASSLSAGSTISVALSGAIMDNSGNALAPVSYSFTTQ